MEHIGILSRRELSCFQDGEGWSLGVVFYTGEGGPAADALVQEFLGPSSVLTLLLDISSDECFFHKRVLLISTGISEDLLFFDILWYFTANVNKQNVSFRGN